MITKAIRKARLDVERALEARYPIIHIVTDDFDEVCQIMERSFYNRNLWDFPEEAYTKGEPGVAYVRLKPDMKEEDLRCLTMGAGASRALLDGLDQLRGKLKETLCICQDELVDSAPENVLKEIIGNLDALQDQFGQTLQRHGGKRLYYARGDSYRDDGSFSEQTITLLEQYVELQIRAMRRYPQRGKAKPEEWPDSCVVLYGCDTVIPRSIERHVYRVDLMPLDEQDFAGILAEYGVKDKDAVRWYADWLAGFSESEIHAVLREIAAACDGAVSMINTIAKPVIERKKRERIKKHGKLEYIEVDEKMEIPDNMKNIREWLDKHKDSIRDTTSKSSDEITKGMLLVGIPGTGKTLAARSVAAALRLPLYQLKMSSVLAKYVGESDKNMEEVLEDVKQAAPLVLWIDEIEKALAGADGGDSSGVMQRLFGQLLTFMQEMNKTVFIVATANDVSRFPAEFKRNGRFDVRCCMPMPDHLECIGIMKKKLDQFLGCGEDDDLARELFAICCGMKDGANARPRFLTGADINAVVKELKVELGNVRLDRCVNHEDREETDKICKAMGVAAASVSMTGESKNLQSIRSIARYYRGMLDMPAMMTGKDVPLLCAERFHPQRILLGDHDNDEPCPTCMDKPENYDTRSQYDRWLFDAVVEQLDLLLAQELKNDDPHQYQKFMKKHREAHKGSSSVSEVHGEAQEGTQGIRKLIRPE